MDIGSPRPSRCAARLSPRPARVAFNDEEIERYARHLVLREIGGSGQQRLKAARVLIVGAGGLGSPAALYLAAASTFNWPISLVA